MLKPILLDYNILESNIKTLHPTRAKKFSQIFHVVRDCIDKGIRPTYRIIHQATKISSKTISAFWKWMKEQGVSLKNIFLNRVDEISGTIQDMMDKGVKPKYRELRKKLKCSFSTISKAFKNLKNTIISFPQNHIEKKSTKPTNYNNARELFHKLSQAEKERYYKQAKCETGSDDDAVIEKFAIGIFARTGSSISLSSPKNKNNPVAKPTLTDIADISPSVIGSILQAFNECLQAKQLKPIKELSRKDKRSLSKLLKSGYELEDIIKVIRFKGEEWLNETKMVPSFRPKTLFRPDNFLRYLNQVIAHENTQKSKYKPIKDGTRVQFNSKIYEVLDGCIYTENGAFTPYMLWELVRDGKAKIVSKF